MAGGRRYLKAAGLVWTVCICVPVQAGIIINQYQTIGETNAWAPLSADQYFQKQTLTNVSPASADATGDWTGTNVGGTSNTWHWVGHGHMDTVTSVLSNVLTISGSGFFSSDLTTTRDFVDPNSVQVLYVPSSAASYTSDFTTDAPAIYTATAQLGKWSALHLGSFAGGVLFDQANNTASAVPVMFTGTLPAGHYFFRAGTGFGGIPFTGHEQGSISDVSFVVQLPEPVNSIAALVAMLIARRSARGKHSCC